MSASTSSQDFADGSGFDTGPSAEKRRFSSGLRLVTALLSAVLLIANEAAITHWTLAVLCGYCLWSAYLLWVEVIGRVRLAAVWLYWIDVAWSCIAMKLTTSGTMMLVLTLVPPVLLTSIGYGVAHGTLLALFAAIGLIFDQTCTFLEQTARTRSLSFKSQYDFGRHHLHVPY